MKKQSYVTVVKGELIVNGTKYDATSMWLEFLLEFLKPLLSDTMSDV